jgi:hypothetical protein
MDNKAAYETDPPEWVYALYDAAVASAAGFGHEARTVARGALYRVPKPLRKRLRDEADRRSSERWKRHAASI